MRPLPTVVLGLALLATGAAAVVALQQDVDLERARAVAARVTAPSAAEVAPTCAGDGSARRCWTVRADVLAVADELTSALSSAAGTTPDRTCDRLPVGTTGVPLSADACFVRVRFGEHGVFVFVDPLTERDAEGVGSVVGATVSLLAS